MKKYTLLFLILAIAGLLTARTGICGSYARDSHKTASDDVIQVADTSSSLKIGDKVPDITFTNLVNYNAKTLKLSDFKNKVVVLDFWATWCSSCLAKFPAERELQNKMPDKFKILLVDPQYTRDTREKVERFFEERKHIYDFTSIVEDTILTKWFPNNGLPHYVWIKNNVVIAIPQPEELTEKNISLAFTDKPLNLAEDTPKKFVSSQNLLGHGHAGISPNIIYYSFLAAFQPGLNEYIGLNSNSNGETVSIDAINQSRLGLILISQPTKSLSPYRVLRYVSKPGDYSADSSSADWKRKNRFTYQAAFSPRTREAACRLMQSDLENYFNVQIEVVARDTSCFVITAGDTSKIVPGKKGVHGETNIWDHLNTPVFFHNMAMTNIAGLLEQQLNMPVINETGYRNRLMLDLPANLDDQSAMCASFLRQGFHYRKESRKVKFLLIREMAHPSSKNNSPENLKPNP